MKILIATGGTGGHIFPAIETAKALRVRGHEVSFAGVLGLVEERIKSLDFPVYVLAAHGLNDRSLKGWFNFSQVMTQAIIRSFGVVRRCNPHKIIGFGGYGAFPVAMAGALMHRPVLVHEQNVMPGKANKVLAKMAKKVAISFEASRKYMDSTKAVWTGCPCLHAVMPSKAEGLRKFSLDEGKKTIVLVGGSQGSQRLNEVFFELMRDLSSKGFQAIHMTGPREFPVYDTRYQQTGLPVRVYPFLNDIAYAYAAADLVVSRSGAATVTELGLLGVPAVLVPYPFAGNHQKYNAQVLGDAGVAMIVEQKDLDKTTLKDAVTRMLLSNYSHAQVLEKTKDLFQKDAALQLALVAEGL